MEQLPKKRFCENCSKELSGRSDQRFCNDNCRNTFNHRQRMRDNEVMNPVINILKKNRAILVKIFESESRTVTHSQLLAFGYKFNYCTERRTLSGSEYYFCFDVGYQILPGSNYEILSSTYFKFIYADFLHHLPNLPTADLDVPEDMAYCEMIREPLHINSELQAPPPTRGTSLSTIRAIE